MDHLLQDIRTSFRHLLKDPRTSFIIILCATLAIGLNSSIFTIVNAFLLRAPGIERPGELARLYSQYPGFDFASLSYPRYVDLREHNEAFSELAAYSTQSVNVGIGGETEQMAGTLVTGNYFVALGVEPAQGRLFTAADDVNRGGHPVTVLSHRMWQTRFGGSDIVGEKILINSQPMTVIGVAAEGFSGTISSFVVDLWAPMQMQPIFMPSDAERMDRPGSGWLSCFGRLAPGVTVDAAQASIDLTMEGLHAEGADEDWTVGVYPGASPIPPNIQSAFKASSVLIMVIVFCVLLIACANVASLLLARAEARQKEISIRLAIGAGRGRLVRQLLTESLVMASIGGVLGTLLALWVSRTFPTLIPKFVVPVAFDATPDATVYGFTLVLTLATGCIFGLVPALQASKPDLVTVLKGESSRGGRRRITLRGSLVTFQVAMSMLLLVGAGLFIRSLQKQREIDPGFTVENVLLGGLDPSLHGYDEERGLQFYDQLRARLAALPGVKTVALGEVVPLTVTNSQQWGVEVEGYVPAEGERMNPDYNIVGEEYFTALEVALEGRAFERTDDADGAQVIIVNQAFVDRFWNGDGLGKRIRMGGVWREVVGVTENGKYRSLRETPQPHIYLPLRQVWEPAMEVHVRTAGDPLALATTVRGVIRELDPNLAFNNVRTLEQHAEGSLLLHRLGAQIIGLLGGLALVLAAVGLFGLLTHGVVRRTREIGIRMSLGAGRGEVFGQLLYEGLKLTLVGLAAGTGLALVAGRFLGGLLYGLEGSDPVTFAVVALVLAGTSVLAVAVPALKATRINPVVALRYE